MKKLDRITVATGVCLGQSTARGMGITVSLERLTAGETIDKVLQAYPELELEDVRQDLLYAAWPGTTR